MDRIKMAPPPLGQNYNIYLNGHIVVIDQGVCHIQLSFFHHFLQDHLEYTNESRKQAEKRVRFLEKQILDKLS